MATAKITPYGDYINQPNATNLDHIPGDYGWPLIGHTFSYLKDPLPWAQDRYQQHGLLQRVCTTGARGVLAMGPDLTQQVLLDSDRNFSSKMGFHLRLQTFFEGSLIMEDFEHHKHQRRIVQNAFKNDALQHYTREINRIYDRALDEWETDVNTNIPFFMYIKDLLLIVAAEIFAGETDYKGDRVRKLNQAFLDAVNGVMYLVPWMIPGTTYYRGIKGKEFLQQFFGAMIAQKRAGDGKDMLSLFSREKDEFGEYFSPEEVTNQAIFLMFAAHDTTTAAITHTIYYLARNPEVKEKLYREVDSVNLDGLLWEDQDKLPYMQMVFNEVQRIRPSVPLVPRRTIRECEMAGHKVPANTMVFIMPRFTHWMDEYWNEPAKFDPERFSPERNEHKKHAFQFFPFGGGAHKCIGMHFAQMEYKNFLFKFMKRYDFEARHKKQDVYMQTFPLPKPSDEMPILLKRR
jgi:cytochrome P450